jgi:hypothetical protein
VFEGTLWEYILPMTGGSSRTVRAALAVGALGILAALVALPVLAASPSPSPPGRSEAKPSKAPKSPEVSVTLTGTVGTTTDADGETTYTLASGGKTYQLEAGPSWFFGDKHPLKPFVGKSVTIVGEQAAGSTEVDVETVNGTRLREPGRPPWAGGWKAVGKIHPGWSQDKWDRWQAKLKARGTTCWPPGHCQGVGGAAPLPSDRATDR